MFQEQTRTDAAAGKKRCHRIFRILNMEIIGSGIGPTNISFPTMIGTLRVFFQIFPFKYSQSNNLHWSLVIGAAGALPQPTL